MIFACAAAVVVACSKGDDAPAGDAGDDGGGVVVTDPCEKFTEAGAPCSVGSATLCFPECATGGCRCAKGVWTCTTDLSCLPDGSPIVDDDSGNVPIITDAGDAGDTAPE